MSEKNQCNTNKCLAITADTLDLIVHRTTESHLYGIKDLAGKGVLNQVQFLLLQQIKT